MANKVILVVLDGLNYQTANECLGFVQALRKEGQATQYRMQCELPSMSRPLYETILTGTRPAVNGIVNNQITRLSNQTSIFSLAKQAGLTTAAAAYHWVSELYNRTPYEPRRDRFTHDPSLTIPYGCFYHADHYPDSHLLIDAEMLRRRHDPDFLLVHPMNIDDTGHRHGVDSSSYRNSARHLDGELSHYLPTWIAAGYQIIITADHGMNADRSHGGILPEETEVPFITIGERFSHDSALTPAQTDICGTICELLEIAQHSKPVTQGLLTLPEVRHAVSYL